jgi:glycosyltransferase involved in cell wall biosynthesis
VEFSGRRERAELDALERVDAISAPTTGLLNALSERATWRLGTVIKNPTPIPADTWSASDADPDQILFIGRMDRLKGADIALNAFALARRERPSLKLWTVGPGEPLPATENVHFLGQLQLAELKRLRLSASLQLCTSRFESFSYAIAEAMALGMPVLSSHTFGSSALIRDGESGRIVRDEDQLPRAMLEMLNVETLHQLGRNARHSATQHLDPEAIAREMLDFYSSVEMSARARRYP